MQQKYYYFYYTLYIGLFVIFVSWKTFVTLWFVVKDLFKYIMVPYNGNDFFFNKRGSFEFYMYKKALINRKYTNILKSFFITIFSSTLFIIRH